MEISAASCLPFPQNCAGMDQGISVQTSGSRSSACSSQASPADRLDALAQRWRALLPDLIDALVMAGLDDREILLTGHPVVVQLGVWGSIVPYINGNGPVAIIRATQPTHAAITVNLDQPTDDLVADLVDAAKVLLARRNRRTEPDCTTKEAELVDMVRLTDWRRTGLRGGSGLCVAFRDERDVIRGRVTRVEHESADPAEDRFEVTITATGLTYAAALEYLVELRRVTNKIMK